MKTRIRALIVIAAAAFALFAGSAAPAFAHEGHTSCQGFGTVEAAIARDELFTDGTKGLGEFASVLAPVNDEVALFHTLGCTPQ